jgi:hypothetical protein
MNFEIVKSGMVVLTERENTDMIDADVVVGCKVQPAAEIVVAEKEKIDVMWMRVMWMRVRYSYIITGTD